MQEEIILEDVMISIDVRVTRHHRDDALRLLHRKAVLIARVLMRELPEVLRDVGWAQDAVVFLLQQSERKPRHVEDAAHPAMHLPHRLVRAWLAIL